MKLKTVNYQFSILIIFTFLVFSCKRESNNLTEKNTIWEKFKIGIENKDLMYLLDNSIDSIKCIDCISSENEKLQSSELIFKKHLEKLYNAELLKGMEYSNYKTDSIIRITYNFEKSFGNESSSIIYMFDKSDEKYLFTGMITTP
ncbi:hypothetical protein [Cellulophaga sp. L1A9]|uniref:hypothetical protein n=1 Tax=Cellulophaga sp. L1A9 TaxID=2686362 RepID=UPI00131E3720|nr:hypothetical protein [Cellulophaga sp. L1A9]